MTIEPQRRSLVSSSLSPRQPWLVFVAWVVIAFTLAPQSQAQGQLDAVITAEVDPAEVSPGGFFTYTITVENATPNAVPNLDLPVTIQPASVIPRMSQERSFDLQGSGSLITVLTWQLVAEVAGTHTIPAQTLQIGGVPYKCNEVKITVKPGAEAPADADEPEAYMQLEMPKRTLYVGEVAPITVHVYVPMRAVLRRVGLIELPKENFAIQRFPLHADEDATTRVGGIRYRVLSFHSTISALKPGKHTLGPASAELLMDIPTGQTGQDFPMRVPQMELRKLRPKCNDLTLQIQELPTEGRPEGFNDLVGDFSIASRADSTETRVGEPVTTEILVTGVGNFDAIVPPKLTQPEAWETSNPKRYNLERSSIQDSGPQSLGFSQYLTPKEIVAEIPAYELSFFSPTKKAYVTVRTDAIPLKVTASAAQLAEKNAATNSDALATKPGEAFAKTPSVQPQITDILAMKPKNTVWLALPPPLWQNAPFRLANLIAVGVLLFLILCKICVVLYRRRAQSPDAPLRKLWRQLHSRRLNRGQFYALAASYAEARNLHGPEIQALHQKHDELSYGPVKTSAEESLPATERDEVLAALRP